MAITLGVVALALRVVWVLSVHRHGYAMNDALFYNLFAQRLASGHGFTLLDGAPSAAWPPAYSFVLSIAFRLFGHGDAVGYLLNALLGAAAVPLVYLVGLRTFGRREAIFAATVLAVFPTQILLTDVMISETFNTLLVIGLFALLVSVPPTRWAAVAAGLLIGVAALTRGESMLMVVIPLVMWWPRLTPARRVQRLAVTLLVAIVVVAPWTIRNAQRMHAFIPVADNSGQTLYAGHNPHATGGSVIPPAWLIAPAQREPDPKREVDRNRILTRYAKNWAIHHPLQELLLIPKRFVALIGDDSAVMPTWIDPGHLGSKSALSTAGSERLGLLLAVGWYSLLAAFVATLVIAGRALWRYPRNLSRTFVQGALTWITLLVGIYCVFLFGQWRYHVSLEPLMMLITAPAACAAWAARGRLADAFSGPTGTISQGGNPPC